MADTIAAPAPRETAPAIASAAKSYSPSSALNFTDITALDRAITADPRRNHHYRIVQVIPYGTEAPPSAWAPTSSGNTSPAPDRPPPTTRFSQVGCRVRRVCTEHRCAGKTGRCVPLQAGKRRGADNGCRHILNLMAPAVSRVAATHRVRPQSDAAGATDRIQALTRAALVMVFLAGAPAAAVWTGHAVYASGLHAGRAQAAACRRVPAVVLRKEPVVTAWDRSGPPPARLSLRWTIPAGSSRTGEMTVLETLRPGSTISVWIDERGWLTHPPWSRAEIIGRAVGAAVAAPTALALLLAIAGSVTSLVLDRRRLADWETDWLAVEPQWTGRQ